MILQFVLYHYFPHPKKLDKKHTYTQIIVLGCPCLVDGSLSSTQRRRIEATIMYYQNSSSTIIISGGSVKNKHIEAQIMAKELSRRLPSATILLEDVAHNTYQNMKFVNAKYPNDDILVISGSSHLRRSYFFARKFYSHVAMAYGNEKDPWYFYIWEYTRMWIALFWEVRLFFKK